MKRITRSSDGWVHFHCPGCGGGHAVPVEGERAWGFNGNFESPTLTPSLLINQGRSNPTAHQCHIFVTNGQIMFLADCSHALAGKTVDMEDVDV